MIITWQPKRFPSGRIWQSDSSIIFSKGVGETLVTCPLVPFFLVPHYVLFMCVIVFYTLLFHYSELETFFQYWLDPRMPQIRVIVNFSMKFSIESIKSLCFRFASSSCSPFSSSIADAPVEEDSDVAQVRGPGPGFTKFIIDFISIGFSIEPIEPFIVLQSCAKKIKHFFQAHVIIIQISFRVRTPRGGRSRWGRGWWVSGRSFNRFERIFPPLQKSIPLL